MDTALSQTRAPVPLCPLTGEPAIRHIGRFSRRFLRILWRLSHGVSLGDLLKDTPHIDLWESPAGLAFFDPPVEGDGPFYTQLYTKDANYRRFLVDKTAYRGDFLAAAAKLKAGDKVLDVGCGRGLFRHFAPEVDYRGLEPYHPDEGKPDWIIKETLDDHAAAHLGAYDAVVAFHMIEHVQDPLSLVRKMVRLLRPGGQLILVCPLWPSVLTEIPNFATNAAPHHVTWWNEKAFGVLCHRLDLADVETATLFGNSATDLVPWMHRFSFIRAGEPYFRPSPLWFASLAISYALALIAAHVLHRRTRCNATDVIVAARKPNA